jgi:hypothetical protein
METDSANPDAGSERDPVSMITGLLEREETPPTERPRGQKPDPETDTPDEDPEPGPEVPPDEGEEDEDGEGQEQEEQPAEPRYTVRIDGKDVEVTQSELLNGYQRQADYSRKTAAAAEARRQADELAQSVQAERQHYAQQLEQVAAVLHATLPAPPPEKMLEDDPIGYLQAQKAWESRVGQLQQVLGERERLAQQQQNEQKQQKQQSLQSAREHLLSQIPAWKDPAKAQKGQTELAEYLRTIGYSDAEIAESADPRAIVGFRKAMLYDRLQATKPAVQQRVAAAPRMVKPGAAGPAPDQRKAVIAQLKRSGGKDLDAAARLIELG